MLSRITRPARHRVVAALCAISPTYRAAKKYDAETRFWRSMLSELKAWYVDGTLPDYWGVPTPATEQRVDVDDDWVVNAILTLHAMRPTYTEELQIPIEKFKGQRVLEVGCGPLVPILQFIDCERHGLDPLIDRYKEIGFPLGKFDIRCVNAYAESIPYPDVYFDAVVSVNALDHVDDFERVSAEMQRVLKPGGRIYINVEYHKPTVTEPVVLNDKRIVSAFQGCDLQAKTRRTGREMFEDMVKRFGLIETDRTRSCFRQAMFVAWHGRRN